jgi:hypothetical protein
MGQIVVSIAVQGGQKPEVNKIMRQRYVFFHTLFDYFQIAFWAAKQRLTCSL